MSNLILLGEVAVRVPVRYTLLQKLARTRTDLPGMVRVGHYSAFDPSKVDDLRELLTREGLIRGVSQTPAVVA